MRLKLSPAQIGIIVVVVLALLAAWFFFSPAKDNTGKNAGNNANNQKNLVLYATQPSAARGPIVPNVITTATKLGQGQLAQAGQATTPNFERPTMSTSAAGSALIIPGSALPGSNWTQQISELPPPTSGTHPRLKYDMYSWSMGTLAATTPQWVDLAEADAAAAVPPNLLAHAQNLARSERLIMVVAPQAGAELGRYKAPLNPHDAYVVIADVMVPAP